MKYHIRSWQDLEQFGVVALTGERCMAYMRLLCDLSPEAAQAIASLWDIKVEALAESWNHQSEEGWRSAMLVSNDLDTYVRWLSVYLGMGFSRAPNEDSTMVLYETNDEYEEAYNHHARWWCPSSDDHKVGGGTDLLDKKPCFECGRPDVWWIAHGQWRRPAKFGLRQNGTATNIHAMSGRGR